MATGNVLYLPRQLVWSNVKLPLTVRVLMEWYRVTDLLGILLLKHYSQLWTLASSTVFLRSRRSLTACLFFIFITFKSSSTSCLHLLLGFPLFHLLGITSAKVSQNAVDFLPSLQGDTAVIL
jgi:hypothetical protein